MTKGFLAQSVRSSNTYTLDSLYSLVLNTETSQSRQHAVLSAGGTTLGTQLELDGSMLVVVNSRVLNCYESETVVCTSTIGSSSYMGLISASSVCVSFPDMLLVSCSFDYVPLLSVSTKLASNALLLILRTASSGAANYEKLRVLELQIMKLSGTVNSKTTSSGAASSGAANPVNTRMKH
ncbi:hypothetical protein Tco_0873211 [Tanacetum coccineum]